MRNTRATQLLFELSKPGRRGGAAAGVRRAARGRSSELLPAEALADAPPPLPELAEPEVVRHFTNLSTLNMSVDTHFYPLGSCTMKYNPKRNERLAGAAGHGRPASLSAGRDAAGHAASCCYELQQMLAEIAGLPAVSLQPAAGAHGELTALLVAAAYFRDRGEKRTKVLDPRQRPRHQPGQRRDGRLRDRARSRARADGLRRPGRPAPRKLDDQIGRVHDHQPEHAGHVRAADRADRRDGPRRAAG